MESYKFFINKSKSKVPTECITNITSLPVNNNVAMMGSDKNTEGQKVKLPGNILLPCIEAYLDVSNNIPDFVTRQLCVKEKEWTVENNIEIIEEFAKNKKAILFVHPNIEQAKSTQFEYNILKTPEANYEEYVIEPNGDMVLANNDNRKTMGGHWDKPLLFKKKDGELTDIEAIKAAANMYYELIQSK